MKTVHYVFPRAGFQRIFRPRDMAQLGCIEVFTEDLVWSTENKFSIVMSDEASDLLVAKLPEEFRAYPVKGDEPEAEAEELPPVIRRRSKASSVPESVPDQSEGEADDDDESSTPPLDPEQ